MADYSVEAKVTPRVDKRDFSKSVERQIEDVTADIKLGLAGGPGSGAGEDLLDAVEKDTNVTLKGILATNIAGFGKLGTRLKSIRNNIGDSAGGDGDGGGPPSEDLRDVLGMGGGADPLAPFRGSSTLGGAGDIDTTDFPALPSGLEDDFDNLAKRIESLISRGPATFEGEEGPDLEPRENTMQFFDDIFDDPEGMAEELGREDALPSEEFMEALGPVEELPNQMIDLKTTITDMTEVTGALSGVINQGLAEGAFAGGDDEFLEAQRDLFSGNIRPGERNVADKAFLPLPREQDPRVDDEEGMGDFRDGDERGQLSLLGPLESIQDSLTGLTDVRDLLLLISGGVSSLAGTIASLPVSLTTALTVAIGGLLAGLTFAFSDEIGNFLGDVENVMKEKVFNPAIDAVNGLIRGVNQFADDLPGGEKLIPDIPTVETLEVEAQNVKIGPAGQENPEGGDVRLANAGDDPGQQTEDTPNKANKAQPTQVTVNNDITVNNPDGQTAGIDVARKIDRQVAREFKRQVRNATTGAGTGGGQ